MDETEQVRIATERFLASSGRFHNAAEDWARCVNALKVEPIHLVLGALSIPAARARLDGAQVDAFIEALGEGAVPQPAALGAVPLGLTPKTKAILDACQKLLISAPSVEFAALHLVQAARAGDATVRTLLDLHGLTAASVERALAG